MDDCALKTILTFWFEQSSKPIDFPNQGFLPVQQPFGKCFFNHMFRSFSCFFEIWAVIPRKNSLGCFPSNVQGGDKWSQV